MQVDEKQVKEIERVIRSLEPTLSPEIIHQKALTQALIRKPTLMQ